MEEYKSKQEYLFASSSIYSKYDLLLPHYSSGQAGNLRPKWSIQHNRELEHTWQKGDVVQFWIGHVDSFTAPNFWAPLAAANDGNFEWGATIISCHYAVVGFAQQKLIEYITIKMVAGGTLFGSFFRCVRFWNFTLASSRCSAYEI